MGLVDNNVVSRADSRGIKFYLAREEGKLKKLDKVLEAKRYPSYTLEDDEAYLRMETVLAVCQWVLHQEENPYALSPTDFVTEFMSDSLKDMARGSMQGAANKGTVLPKKFR